jgi:hypothetical protein
MEVQPSFTLWLFELILEGTRTGRPSAGSRIRGQPTAPPPCFLQSAPTYPLPCQLHSIEIRNDLVRRFPGPRHFSACICRPAPKDSGQVFGPRSYSSTIHSRFGLRRRTGILHKAMQRPICAEAAQIGRFASYKDRRIIQPSRNDKADASRLSMHQHG